MCNSNASLVTGRSADFISLKAVAAAKYRCLVSVLSACLPPPPPLPPNSTVSHFRPRLSGRQRSRRGPLPSRATRARQRGQWLAMPRPSVKYLASFVKIMYALPYFLLVLFPCTFWACEINGGGRQLALPVSVGE